jgi:DNA (cytosine-5)-methyltransferase 1
MVGGIKTIGFSEIEPYACSILKKHWPDVPNFGDIRNIKGVRAELVTGGFPCQPFSVAGKRRGASDDRALWPEMCRVIADAKPAWVLGENVPGIIGMELDRVLSDLENLGYSAWPLVIPACAADASHRRDRVWILAAKSNSKPSSEQKREHQRPENNSGSGANELDAGPDVVNANSQGQQHAGESNARERLNGEGQPTNRTATSPMRWDAEPGMGRVADGIPNRLDRLRGLGNAIVPQVAAEIIRTMMRVAGLHNDQAEPRRGEKQ